MMTTDERAVDSVPSSEEPEPLGRMLARLRRDRELTGSALARESGVSQGQISKIENLRVTPSVADVRKLTTALGLPAALAANLAERARHDQRKAANSRAGRRGDELVGKIDQQDWMDEEAAGRRVRSFEPLVVPGLLQTSEYARQILEGYNAVQYGDNRDEWPESSTWSVAVRAARQERLNNPAVLFEFIVMESALRYRFGAEDWPVLMAGQIQRIESVRELPNVSIRILPFNTPLSYPPVEAFEIVDDSVVLTESTVGGGYRDRKNVRLFVHAFEDFWSRATDDVEPILRRYKAELLEEVTHSLA